MLGHILLIFTYFTQWFIYNFKHDDASMVRCDKRDLDKKLIWPVFEHEKIHINLPFTRSRKSKDVEIVGAEI